MVYDGAVSAIKHGAVFSTVGILLSNVIITILLPFLGYVIIKTAKNAAKVIIYNTISIAKDTTTTLVKFQTKACKSIVSTVSRLTTASLEICRILIRQIMMTMRRLAGFGTYYVRKCMDTALGFKDLAISFVKKGLVIIKKSTSITITTVRKLAEMIMTLLINVPEKLFKLMEVIFQRVFPGMFKIMTYFPAEYFKFMTRWLPAEINFLYTMCTKIVELDMAATSMVVLFHLIATGIKFVGKFYTIGKDFVIDFVAGINGALDVIPAFGEILDSDTVAAIPDRIISFVLYQLNFATGFNSIFDASTTTLPQIEAKEAQIAAKASELSGYETEQTALQRQIEISPDPDKSAQISQLQIIIDALTVQLNVLKGELAILELNRVFTFDELLLRTFFMVISLFHVYTTPPPIPRLVSIFINGVFNRDLTPNIYIPFDYGGSLEVLDVEVGFSVYGYYNISSFRLSDIMPIATAIESFASWLDTNLRKEEAYEIVDGKKKSKIRAITTNPACFAKFVLRAFYYWLIIAIDSASIDVINYVTYDVKASFNFGDLEVDLGVGDALDALGFGSAQDFIGNLVAGYVASNGGSTANFFATNAFGYLIDTVFSTMSFACDEEFSFLS